MTAAAAPPLIYTCEHWQDGQGRRHLKLWVELLVQPYTRQNKGTRWRKDRAGKAARTYNDSRGALRDAFSGIKVAQGLSSFGKVKLGMAASFKLPEAAEVDLDNLEKACQDAMQGILFHNDNQIWERGSGVKDIGPGEFSVELWEAG